MTLRRLAEGLGWFALFGVFVFLRWVTKGLLWLVGPVGCDRRHS